MTVAFIYLTIRKSGTTIYHNNYCQSSGRLDSEHHAFSSFQWQTITLFMPILLVLRKLKLVQGRVKNKKMLHFPSSFMKKLNKS
jgi:hypothetical protein